MSKPLISYVITSYNSENFIEKAIDCAFAQTYSPLEIVISDDCSSDNTFNIIKSKVENYNGPHKIVINRNEKRMGISQHMSKAYIDIATGEIIVVAHADDISKENRVQKSYEYLSSHPNCNVVSFAYTTVDENLNVISHNKDFEKASEYIFTPESRGNAPAPSRAFYREIMTKFGYLNEKCPTEDELITNRAFLLKGNSAYVCDELVFYRKHKDSASNPENFKFFPLEEILNQKIIDMNKAISMGLYTEKERDDYIKEAKKGIRIRNHYRAYFASRKIKDLIKLIFLKEVPLRKKLSYIKMHIKYKVSKNAR